MGSSEPKCDGTVKCQAVITRGKGRSNIHFGRCSLTARESRATTEGDEVVMCGIHLRMADGMPAGMNGMRFMVHGAWVIRHVLWPGEAR